VVSQVYDMTSLRYNNMYEFDSLCEYGRSAGVIVMLANILGCKRHGSAMLSVAYYCRHTL